MQVTDLYLKHKEDHPNDLQPMTFERLVGTYLGPQGEKVRCIELHSYLRLLSAFPHLLSASLICCLLAPSVVWLL